jgi:hypothetical protein
VLRGQHNGFLRPYSRFSRPELLSPRNFPYRRSAIVEALPKIGLMIEVSSFLGAQWGAGFATLTCGRSHPVSETSCFRFVKIPDDGQSL